MGVAHRPLGPIQFARIWHDNSGKGKFQGWYCRSMMVHDLQTKEKFFFIVNDWLALEEADGQVSAELTLVCHAGWRRKHPVCGNV